MERQVIRAQLAAHFPEQLVDELLEAHAEAKRAFYLGGLRLSEVEGGRFCEAAFRLLEYATAGQFTPLGKHLDTDRLIERLANLSVRTFGDAIRIHIPRSLRVVYDIRNKRDAAHLADGIDPNLQDSTFVLGVLDWVLAEFIRIYHKVPPDEASKIADGLVTRAAPLIQDFDGFLKVLNPTLLASQYCLVLLYQKGKLGATLPELIEWVKPKMRANLRRTLDGLAHQKAFVHEASERYFITRSGELEVERAGLFELQ